MNMISIILASIVGLEHVYILYLEMFQANSEKAANAFGIERDFLKDNRVQTLFKNQGLYNGFLAFGIFYGLLFASNTIETVTLFLVFVLIAAIYGGITSSKSILIKQGLPACLALLSIILLG